MKNLKKKSIKMLAKKEIKNTKAVKGGDGEDLGGDIRHISKARGISQ